MLGYLLGITLVLTVLSPFVFSDVFAETFVVNTDKQSYNVGDSLTVSGEILDFGMPVIAMSIYDPDGKILTANNLEISPEKTFTKTLSLDSPFYAKAGEYKLKLAYGQITEDHYFLINGESESELVVPISAEPEIILLYTDKKQYTDNEIIHITGIVSALGSPTALIGVYDPYGMPAGFYFGTINSDLEFSTNFLVKDGVNFRTEGTYSIKAHYAETEAISFFEYHKDFQTVIEESAETTEDTAETIEDTAETIEDTAETIEDTAETIDETIQETTGTEIIVSDDSSSIKETSKDTESKSQNNSIITKTNQEDIQKTKNSDSQIKTINEKDNSKKILIDDNKKSTNLSVEDIELGIILNQMNLECDSSVFTDTISYYDGMGPALYRLCNFDGSLNFFNESLIENPDDVEILVNKGSALGKLGYFTEAIVYYDHAIKIDPDFLPAKNNKANALANLKDYDNAISLYEEILTKNPNYLSARKNLALALSFQSPVVSLVDESLESDIEKVVYFESNLPQVTNRINDNLEKPTTFFDEVGVVLSTLGSLFGFLN
ncbi:tetratricopeptide repeat protein [Nitrosopumilus sp.]|uniref:tetratricopeptide repeat protein n=1 Tax=Nitrosopumilus sp. TaxID=2024843 RepID=UPI00247C5732|nr:tetratricopeptide repeat protein [Nitrosopumilus sp.]MCV0410303.1 tetratricopeptide repeat protein [Nitrosopumilus sp.]